MNATRSLIRASALAWFPLASARKNAPHTIIPGLPCATTWLVPLIEASTSDARKTPFCLASVVRLVGRRFIALDAGPSPFPPSPWHAAHDSRKVALPLSTAARSGFAVCATVAVDARAITQKTATAITFRVQTLNFRELIIILPGILTMSRFLAPVVDNLDVEGTGFVAHALEIDPDQQLTCGGND